MNPDKIMKESTLDPQVKAYLQEVEARNLPAPETVEEAREGIIQTIQEEWTSKTPDLVKKIQNILIPGSETEIPVRVYTPEGNSPFPILVFYHGGGWMQCTLDTHDNVCRSFAKRANCLVFSVDYRLAPEHKFPAGIEDAYIATKWIAENAARFGGDPSRLAVSGDSSGGNFAAVVCLMSRDRGGPAITYQLLIYPVTNISSLGTESYHTYAEGYLLTKADMEWYRDLYLENGQDCLNPYVSPLLAENLAELPPACVVTAECDVLRDEAEAYAGRLKKAGVPVTCTRYAGMIHAFISMEALLERTSSVIDEICGLLRNAFNRQSAS